MGSLFSRTHQMADESAVQSTLLESGYAKKLAVSATDFWKNWRKRHLQLTRSGLLRWHRGMPVALRRLVLARLILCRVVCRHEHARTWSGLY